MKDYPSILSSNGSNFTEFDAYVFDKIDGSNLRFEWSKNKGWHKSGTRTRLFDKSDEVFGCALDIFQQDFAEPLTKIAVDNRWQSFLVYAEFWGENSFAGTHYPEDKKYLYLFDAVGNKKGLMGPKQFLATFEGKVSTVNFLGHYKWTRGFVERVKNNEIEGVSFEGVVGKAGEGHNLTMRKAKTQKWLDAVKAKYGADAERYI